MITDIAVPAAGFWPETPFTKQSNLRLFYDGVNQYVVFANLDAASRKVLVSKSTDNGATWNLVGGPGPTLYFKLDGMGIDLLRETLSAVQSGSLLYVFHSEVTNGYIAVTIFDMGTDTWGATFTSNYWYFSWYIDPNTFAWTDLESAAETLTATLRDTGNFIVAYYGECHVNGGFFRRLHYVEFDDAAKTFGVEIQTTVDSIIPGVGRTYMNPQVHASGDRIHFWCVEIDAIHKLTQRSLNVANALGTQQNVGATPNLLLAEMVVGQPIAFTYLGINYIACPYNYRNGTNKIGAVWGVSADNPALTAESPQSALTPNQINLAWPSFMLFNGACLYCLWATQAKDGANPLRIDFYVSVKWMCDLSVPWRNQTLVTQDLTANRNAYEATANLRNGKADIVYSGAIAIIGSAPVDFQDTGYVATQQQQDLPACPCGLPHNLYVTVKRMCDLAVPWQDQILLAADVTFQRRIFESRVRFRPAQNTVDYVYSGDTSADATGYVHTELDLAVPECPCGQPPPPGNCLMYALPIYIGPHNHVWKLGVAQQGSPVLSQPGVIIGTDVSISIPTGFVDTSRINTPGIVPLQAILTAPQHTNFYASRWKVTALGMIFIVVERDTVCNFEAVVCRLNMQIPHSIVGDMPGEVI